MKYKRSLALLLAVILSLGSVMASLAAGVLDDAPPGGKPGQGKAEWNTISENYGYRLSMTSVYPYWEEGYVPSINNYPEINFDTFMSEVNTLVTENYLESGNTGMYYISEPNGFKAVDNDLKLRHTQLTKLRNNPGPRDNPLAQWYMANQDLATKMTCDGTWKTIPDVAGVSGAQCVDLISQMVGSGVSNNFKEFSMSVGSTHNPDNNVDIDYIGYSMALIALWKAAESTDAAVAADMENLLNQYFKTDSKGDTAKNFPIITVESVVGVVNYNGDSFWLTLPDRKSVV